jgi:hypothetical protein
MKSVIAAALVLATGALAAPALAQPPLFGDSDYAREQDGWRGGGYGDYNLDLRGQWVDNAKRQLSNAGYRAARSVRFDGKQYDLWTNDRSRGGSCVGFTSYNGRVTDVRNFRDSECGGYGGGYGDGGWGGGDGRGFNPRDLRGLSVDQAKRALANDGFRGARSVRLGGQQWDLWYENRGRNNQCVGFTSYNGRVTDARAFSDRDCY